MAEKSQPTVTNGAARPRPVKRATTDRELDDYFVGSSWSDTLSQNFADIIANDRRLGRVISTIIRNGLCSCDCMAVLPRR